MEEYLSLTSLGRGRVPAKFNVTLTDRSAPYQAIREGRKVFVSHSKIERSPMVRKQYFLSHPEIVCNACSLQARERYPWTDNILELHHILPLSATLNVNGVTTSLDDMVPLCPSCHRSIHVYYVKKLDEWDIPDFGSKKMARDVYDMAKREIQP